MSPKLWNTGSALSTMSEALKSIRAASWWQLASRLRWLSTTPLGSPSEPLVNRITAGASGATFAQLADRGEAAGQPRAQLGAGADAGADILEIEDRKAFRFQPATPPRRSFAWSTKARAVTIVRISAAVHAAFRLARPAV